MTATPSKPLSRKPSSGVFVVLFVVLMFGMISGKVPNFLDRFVEISGGTYHALNAEVANASSPQLKRMLKDALDHDGKLTLANMKPIWEVRGTTPEGHQFPERGSVDLTGERDRLIALVGSNPGKTVWTWRFSSTD